MVAKSFCTLYSSAAIAIVMILSTGVYIMHNLMVLVGVAGRGWGRHSSLDYMQFLNSVGL